MKNSCYSSYLFKRFAAVMLAVTLTFALIIPAAGYESFAADGSSSGVTSPTVAPNGKKVTTVTVNKTAINKKKSSNVTIKAQITPAKGTRKVKLQRYNSTDKQWETISTAITEDKKTADVAFSIPAEYRNKTTSKWRVYVSKTAKANSGKSAKITLTTRNLKGCKMSAKAACIYRIDGNGTDGVGNLIYTRNSTTPRAQASTTKLMTAVLLVESGKLESKTKISSHAASTPWGSGHLYAGDVFNTHDLLYAMLLPSSNDAATAVAEKVGGSEAAFVEMMNNKALAMGCTNTHFRNPHGLDADGHYTTAAELAKLTAYAYSIPEIRECWATNYKQITSLKYKNRWNLWSTNAIFQYVKNFLGGKTGTEDNAGCCFTGVYTYKGKTYVTVVLGSGYGFSRWADTQALHKYIRKYAATKY